MAKGGGTGEGGDGQGIEVVDPRKEMSAGTSQGKATHADHTSHTNTTTTTPIPTPSHTLTTSERK